MPHLHASFAAHGYHFGKTRQDSFHIVKVDEKALWRELGVVGREPRWAIAWKFPPTTKVTTLNGIGRMAFEPAMAIAGRLLAKSALIMACSLIVIAMIDVPFQRWQFMKQMRMSKQEIKDEMKDMEGRPEVKAQIKRRQREMANGRMIDRVKDADVVITNPEHFAVALSYDPNGDSAPILLAKGSDEIAARIREEATKHGIEIFRAPPLARALFYTTEIEHPVPEDLYYAVAQVIAYVFNLASVRPGQVSTGAPTHKASLATVPAWSPSTRAASATICLRTLAPAMSAARKTRFGQTSAFIHPLLHKKTARQALICPAEQAGIPQVLRICTYRTIAQFLSPMAANTLSFAIMGMRTGLICASKPKASSQI